MCIRDRNLKKLLLHCIAQILHAKRIDTGLIVRVKNYPNTYRLATVHPLQTDREQTGDCQLVAYSLYLTVGSKTVHGNAYYFSQCQTIPGLEHWFETASIDRGTAGARGQLPLTFSSGGMQCCLPPTFHAHAQ